MKILRFIFMLFFVQFLSFYVKAQNNHSCDCSVLVNPVFKGKIGLYDNKGKVIKYVKHNFVDEDYLILDITKESDTMFYVSASYSIAGFIGKGWINKIDVIGVYLKVYSGSFALYDSQSKGSNKIMISKLTNQLLPVSSCKDKWVKISFLQDDKIITGWLPPEEQCDNPYSSCN